MSNGELVMFVPGQQPMIETCRLVNMLNTAGFKLEFMAPASEPEIEVVRLEFKRQDKGN